MKTIVTLAAIAALPGFALAQSAAQPATSPPRQCFFHSQLRNTVVVDDSTINARVGDQTWQLRMEAPCPGLEMSRAGYVLKLPPGTSRFCDPDDFHITVNDFGAARCFVQSARPLTAAEVEALPPKARP